MDTRRKIQSPAAVIEAVKQAVSRGEVCRLVTGFFDPLLAANAQRIREWRASADCLVVVVDSPARPLLPAEARANLVAGLRGVDYVVIAGGQVELLAAFPLPAVLRTNEADHADTKELERRVYERQGN